MWYKDLGQVIQETHNEITEEAKKCGSIETGGVLIGFEGSRFAL